MAKIRNTASMLHVGRIGNTTYYVSGGEQVARVARNSSNYGETAKRTLKQQSRRAKWANLVDFYKVSRGWMRKAFESKGPKQSDYNKFMSININQAGIYLTKSQYAQGGCVVIGYKVSEGSLRSIEVNKNGNAWVTDIQLGALAITDTTTVAEFTAAVLNNNNYTSEGMQLSFISYQQTVDANGIPQVSCTAYEVTLSLSNTSHIREYLPEFCSSVVNSCLGTNNNISLGAFAYVWSDSTSGKTYVSSQTLVTNNATLISQYTSPLAEAESIESYGLDADVFLESGSKAVTSSVQPISIVSIVDAFGEAHAANSVCGVLDDVINEDDHLTAVFANTIEGTISGGTIVTENGHTFNLAYVSKSSAAVIMSVSGWSTYGDEYLKRATIVLDGTEFTIEFENSGTVVGG